VQYNPIDDIARGLRKMPIGVHPPEFGDDGSLPVICPTCQVFSEKSQSVAAGNHRLLCMGLFFGP
jgi:hypothetical protein